MSTGQFSKAVVVADKTQKRRYIYVFGTWIVILNLYPVGCLTLRKTSYVLGYLLAFEKDVCIRPWHSKG